MIDFKMSLSASLLYSDHEVIAPRVLGLTDLGVFESWFASLIHQQSIRGLRIYGTSSFLTLRVHESLGSFFAAPLHLHISTRRGSRIA